MFRNRNLLGFSSDFGIYTAAMDRKLRILSIEDDEYVRKTIIANLSAFWCVDGADKLKPGLAMLNKQAYDVLILDKELPDGNGIHELPSIVRKFPDLAVIILTKDDNLSDVRFALDNGAMDYLTKATTPSADLLIRVPMAIARLAAKRKTAVLEEAVKLSFTHELLGNSEETENLRKQIQRLKGKTLNVLITGESGTGKELIAKRLWAIEDDPSRPYFAINCGAIPENLLEDELFGHRKGAFTGAERDKKGRFELASGGDLFLDEIGDLPYPMQVKLLRAIEQQEIFPLGAEAPVKINVRIISATNKDLSKLIKVKRRFREDLYYRLDGYKLHTAPLRDRPSDIEPIVQRIALKHLGPEVRISPTTIDFLKSHNWPGNVRELCNWVERAMITIEERKGSVLEVSDFQIDQDIFSSVTRQRRKHALPYPETRTELSEDHYSHFMREAERKYLEMAIGLCDGHAYTAAQLVGLGRTTIFNKMKTLNIPVEQQCDLVKPGLRVSKKSPIKKGRQHA
jgi:DNA-binding NtrC family response regulator